MELITSPKSSYLLDAGLDVLHAQSNEWLNEISFWRNEADFFYTLMIKKANVVPLNAKRNIEKIEGELTHILGSELDELKRAVEGHEGFLKYLLQNRHENQESYREKHKQLSHIFNQFEKRFKSLKQGVFDLTDLIDND